MVDTAICRIVIVNNTGEEVFPGTCDNGGVRSVGVFYNTSEFGHEHRFIRTTNDTNRSFTAEDMWINIGFNNSLSPTHRVQAMTKRKSKLQSTPHTL
uniref:Uncharacterized protein n=1 Tax=Angiostrongylus cantonensis TaxID=6313 RepID=A0A0K0DMV5_ANGCA